MDLANLKTLLHGAVVMGCWVAILFFLRYWRASRDRLFLLFALAFGVMSMNWLALALLRTDDESRFHLFSVRLVAFLIILYAVWDKNRAGRSAR
ncbi:MAG TPA: DUF5985 family protein [Aggregicoccus sp.]|nr:DUF5985 family protein [Aggregicoccus sp.]